MSVAVVIPIYKANPTLAEKASVAQTLAVLHQHHIYYVIPKGLSLSKYPMSQNVRIIEFNPTYFLSVKSYNKLMFSASFYKKFKSFQFMLLVQTDAWVFRDELNTWTEKGFDYVGAPWIQIPPLQKKPLVHLAKLLYQRVGNGGFCLRRVSTFYRICVYMPFLSYIFTKNEDLFWGYFAQKLGLIKTPDWKQALMFSFELAPSKAFALNCNQLPMGCHAWEKYENKFWKKYIHIS
jgi:hypothetical protein